MKIRKLYAIQDRTAAPPGNWHVVMPETGANIASGTYHSLFAAVQRYRQENGLELWTHEVFEDTLCRQLPPNSTNCGLEAVNPHDFPELSECIRLNAEDAPKDKWGGIFWGVLHRHKLTDEEADGDFLRAFTQLIPCTVTCQPHFQQWQAMNPPPIDDQDQWFHWTWLAHADVRKRQGKLVISEENARREWLGE